MAANCATGGKFYLPAHLQFVQSSNNPCYHQLLFLIIVVGSTGINNITALPEASQTALLFSDINVNSLLIVKLKRINLFLNQTKLAFDLQWRHIWFISQLLKHVFSSFDWEFLDFHMILSLPNWAARSFCHYKENIPSPLLYCQACIKKRESQQLCCL